MSFTCAGDMLGINHATGTTLHRLFNAKNIS